VVRRAAAAFDKGVRGLAVESLRRLFITHLHSDHTVGLPDLIFTTWVQGRRTPLEIVGPAGTKAMADHVMMAWQVDIDVRTKGLEGRQRTVVNARDVTTPGLAFEDANVKVTAFHTKHGEYPDALGYRFVTADRTIVISGDTNPSPALIEHCAKCDVLIHEAYAEDYRPADVASWVEYRGKYHTTTTQLAEIARQSQPKLLVVYHRGVGPKGREISEQQYLAEIQRTYSGKVVIARDLDIY
jgi:ribonuclease Z